VMRANFAEDRDIAEVEVIQSILVSLGLPVEDILARAESPENKLALRQQTEKAGEIGLFGAPSFVTPDGELFWGNDRLEDALEWVRAHAAAP
jgi:2-hydroxychromene-2-carboxylate isomerase